ncbi:hypothetical protein F5Y16DRAFT_420824 [Xylariaceae sp. FL0255]|nr:hypothetical protein F5Y16DRAFT_420824 [Xylariaceae sp. FL0255]
MRLDTAEPCGSRLTRKDWHDQVLYFTRLAIQRDDVRKTAADCDLRFIVYAGEDIMSQHLAPVPSCTCCKRLSFFPQICDAGESTTCRLRLTEEREMRGCTHYLAVSYRWPTQNHEQPEFYCVTTKGEARANIAPNKVLQRAIEFAALEGIRAIWIDQECIDQNERNPQAKYEKQIAIQSMDTVFQQAMLVCGLLSVTVRTEEQLKAILLIYQLSKLDLSPQKVDKGLELLMADDWFRRSWILQEASLASQLWLHVGIDPKIRPINVTRDICLWEWGLKHCLHILMLSLDPRLKYEDSIVSPGLKRRLRDIAGDYQYSRPGFLHPQPGATAEADPKEPYSRIIINAAEAVRYLRNRGNAVCSDRLPIIANLCDYQVRIDTTNLQQRMDSLSAGVFTLALLNGDLSLLVGLNHFTEQPSIYRSQTEILDCGKTMLSHQHSTSPGPRATDKIFSWLPAESSVIDSVDWSLGNNCRCRLCKSALSPYGLLLSGVLWQVGKVVMFPALKSKYGVWLSKDGKVRKGGELYAKFFWDLLAELRDRGLKGLMKVVWEYAGGVKIKTKPSEEDWWYPDDPNGPLPYTPDNFEELFDPNSSLTPRSDEWRTRRRKSMAPDEVYLCDHYEWHYPRDIATRFRFMHRRRWRPWDPDHFTWGFNREFYRNNEDAMAMKRAWYIRGDESRVEASWVVSSILRSGSLWCGTASNPTLPPTTDQADESLNAIFDVNGPIRVITPICTGWEYYWPDGIDKIRWERMSWVAEPTGESMEDNTGLSGATVTTMTTKGMVRCLWSSRDVSPEVGGHRTLESPSNV